MPGYRLVGKGHEKLTLTTSDIGTAREVFGLPLTIDSISLNSAGHTEFVFTSDREMELLIGAHDGGRFIDEYSFQCQQSGTFSYVYVQDSHSAGQSWELTIMGYTLYVPLGNMIIMQIDGH